MRRNQTTSLHQANNQSKKSRILKSKRKRRKTKRRISKNKRRFKNQLSQQIPMLKMMPKMRVVVMKVKTLMVKDGNSIPRSKLSKRKSKKSNSNNRSSSKSYSNLKGRVLHKSNLHHLRLSLQRSMSPPILRIYTSTQNVNGSLSGKNH